MNQTKENKQWLQKGHHVVSSNLTLDGTVWNNPNPKPQFNGYRQQSHHNNNNRHNNQRGGHDNRHQHRRGRY